MDIILFVNNDHMREGTWISLMLLETRIHLKKVQEHWRSEYSTVSKHWRSPSLTGTARPRCEPISLQLLMINDCMTLWCACCVMRKFQWFVLSGETLTLCPMLLKHGQRAVTEDKGKVSDELALWTFPGVFCNHNGKRLAACSSCTDVSRNAPIWHAWHTDWSQRECLQLRPVTTRRGNQVNHCGTC